MKLIIDIPEEEYEMRKLWAKSDSLSSPDTMWISKGVPYEESPEDKWIPVSERLPEEKFSGGAFGFDFEEVLCTTIWGDVRSYKFGKPIGHDRPHFWLCGTIMDVYVIAWQYKPKPYKKGSVE